MVLSKIDGHCISLKSYNDEDVLRHVKLTLIEYISLFPADDAKIIN